MPSNGRAPCSLLSRMRAPRCFSASAACSCDRRDVWYMVYSCYLFRFLSYYSMARVDVVTSAPCLSSRSTVSWSSQIRRAVCTSVVEADVSVWPRCFLAVCLQLCCVRSLIDIYFTGSDRPIDFFPTDANRAHELARILYLHRCIGKSGKCGQCGGNAGPRRHTKIE